MAKKANIVLAEYHMHSRKGGVVYQVRTFSFIHLFVRSFVQPFIHSFVQSFIHSFIHPYTH